MTSMQGASMNDFWLRSWSLSGIENVSVLLKNRFAFDRKALRLFFSSRELFFSSIWTVWTSLRSVRQLSDLGKWKVLPRKEKFVLFCFPSLETLFHQGGIFILWHLETSYVVKSGFLERCTSGEILVLNSLTTYPQFKIYCFVFSI